MSIKICANCYNFGSKHNSLFIIQTNVYQEPAFSARIDYRYILSQFIVKIKVLLILHLPWIPRSRTYYQDIRWLQS
jgi:hypothetical protein